MSQGKEQSGAFEFIPKPTVVIETTAQAVAEADYGAYAEEWALHAPRTYKAALRKDGPQGFMAAAETIAQTLEEKGQEKKAKQLRGGSLRYSQWMQRSVVLDEDAVGQLTFIHQFRDFVAHEVTPDAYQAAEERAARQPAAGVIFAKEQLTDYEVNAIVVNTQLFLDEEILLERFRSK